jgi:transposase
MGRYSEERRTAVLSKLLPPYNGVVSQVSREEGICTATLYNWLKSARKRGVAVPGSRKKTAEDWSGETKLAVVLETASLNAEELSRYCRGKGLYPEQIVEWKQACIDTAQLQPDRERQVAQEVKQLKQRNRALEKELRRKEKALAESAALLVLQKKYRALWEDEDE